MYKHRERRKPHRYPALTALAAVLALLAAAIAANVRMRPAAPDIGAAKPLPLVPRSSPAPTEEAQADVSAEAAPVETAEAAEAPQNGGSVLLKSDKLTVSIDGEPVGMELEEYLVGVVAAEMPASNEFDALCAQAVAARTFAALHMAGRAKCRSGCTVCSDPKCCQAYRTDAELHAFWGAGYEENIQKIRAAVKETEGAVATWQGELISALYHASSGPATEDCSAVFAAGLPYLVSVSSYEGDREMTSVQEFGEHDIAERLNAAFPQAQLNEPIADEEISVWGRNEGGRAMLVRVGEALVSGTQMRQALGLRSTAFEISRKGSVWSFSCTGYGHGVGMSQLGANEMAKLGCGWQEILRHFYTGITISKLEYAGGGAESAAP